MQIVLAPKKKNYGIQPIANSQGFSNKALSDNVLRIGNGSSMDKFLKSTQGIRVFFYGQLCRTRVFHGYLDLDNCIKELGISPWLLRKKTTHEPDI